MRHAYPRFDWTPCSEPPDNCRRVVVWHRVRPWCRFYKIVVGWWNVHEWRWDYHGEDPKHAIIYQPHCWKDIEPPIGHRAWWVSVVATITAAFLFTGCSTPRLAMQTRPFTPGIAWYGQVNQVYFVEWTPWQYDQWVDISGPLQFLTTNMLWIVQEPGAYRIATENLP